jgi:hypothetical protein
MSAAAEMLLPAENKKLPCKKAGSGNSAGPDPAKKRRAQRA